MSNRISTRLSEYAKCDLLTIAEIRYTLKHWDSATSKLHSKVIQSVKALDRIPPALQVQLIETSDRSAAAIGELLCAEAQELIAKHYSEDMPVVIKHLPSLSVVSDSVWRYLARTLSELKSSQVKQLVVRKDCPPFFAKKAGYTKDTFVKERIKDAVTRTTRLPRQKTVKSGDSPIEQDFLNTRKVVKAVRTVSRKR